MTLIRYFILLLTLLVLLTVSIAGLRGCKSKRPPIEIFPDMVRQPKVKAQAPSGFYADGRGARLPVAGTVPAGYEPPVAGGNGSAAVVFAGLESYADTGKKGSAWGNGIPFTVTRQTLERGRERYQIQCAVCHGATGAGNGIAGKYGLVGIANLHQQRLRDMTDGELYNTVANGKNTMMGYGGVLPVADRWEIVAYVRALQRSQNATLADVPAPERAALQEAATPAKP